MMPAMTRLFCLGIAVAISVISVPVSAQETAWNIRPWDTKLDPKWVRENIVGTSITLIDGGTAHYEADGLYRYVYIGGNTFTGTYEVAEDGALCVTFESGAARCDLYVKQGEKLLLITEDGGRYPQAE